MARYTPFQRQVNLHLAKKINHIRLETGLSLAKVSRISGISVPTLFYIESGDTHPRMDHLMKLYKAYGDPLIKEVSQMIKEDSDAFQD